MERDKENPNEYKYIAWTSGLTISTYSSWLIVLLID